MYAGELNREIEDRLRVLENAGTLMVDAMNGKGGGIQQTLEDRPALPRFFNGGLFVTDTQGTVIASIPVSAERLGLNYMERDHVSSALKEGKSTVSKPVIGKALQSPVVSMGAPIRDSAGTIARHSPLRAAAERGHWGFAYTDVGAELCRQWRLPSQFPDAIAASAIVLEGSGRPHRRLADRRIKAFRPKHPFTPKAAP
jgi:hypothetical protein